MMPFDFVSVVLGQWTLMFPLAVALLMWLSVDLSLLGSIGGGKRRRIEAQERIAAIVQEAPVVGCVQVSRRVRRHEGRKDSSRFPEGIHRKNKKEEEEERVGGGQAPMEEVREAPVHRVRIPTHLRIATKTVKHRVVVVVVGDFARSPRMQYHAMSLATCGRFDQVTLVGLREGNALSEALLRCGEAEEEDYIVVDGKLLRLDTMSESEEWKCESSSAAAAAATSSSKWSICSPASFFSAGAAGVVPGAVGSEGGSDVETTEQMSYPAMPLSSYTNSDEWSQHNRATPLMCPAVRREVREAFPSSSRMTNAASGGHRHGCQINAQYLVSPPQLPAWLERQIAALPLPSKVSWLIHTVYRVTVLAFLFFSLLMRALVVRVNSHGQLEVTSFVLFQTPPCIPVLLIARYLVRPLALVYNYIMYYGFIVPASVLHTDAVKDVTLSRSKVRWNACDSGVSDVTREQKMKSGSTPPPPPPPPPSTHKEEKNEENTPSTPSSSLSFVGLVSKRIGTLLRPRRVFYPTYIVDWHNYGYTILESMHRPKSITAVYRFLELKCCAGDINLTVSQAMRRSLRRNLLGESPEKEEDNHDHREHRQGSDAVQETASHPEALVHSACRSSSEEELVPHSRTLLRSPSSPPPPPPSPPLCASDRAACSTRPLPLPHRERRGPRLSEDVYVLYDVAPSFFAPASRRQFVEEVVKPLSGGCPVKKAAGSAAQEGSHTGVDQHASSHRGRAGATHDGPNGGRQAATRHTTVRHRHRRETFMETEGVLFSSSRSSSSSGSSGSVGGEGAGAGDVTSELRADGIPHPEEDGVTLPASYAYSDDDDDNDDYEDANNPLNAAGVRRLLREIADSTTSGGTSAGHDGIGVGVTTSSCSSALSLHVEGWGISPPPAWVLEEAEEMEWGAGRASGASGISPRAHLKRPRHHRRRCRADQRADGVLELSDNDDDEEDEEGSDSESDSDSEDSGYEAIRDRHPGAFSPALPLFVRRRGLIVVGSTSWTPDDDYSILIEALHRLDFRLCQQEQQQQHAGLYGPSPLMPSSASSSAAAAREAEGHSPVRSPTLLHQTSGRFLSPGGGGGAGRTPFFSHRRPRPLDVWVLITGKGPGRARFEAQIKAAGLSSHVVVSTVYLQSYLQYSITLGAADVGLCLHQSSSGLDLPMKAVDMLGAGLPVIALDYEAIPELLGERLPATIGTLGCPPQSVSPHKDKITGSSRESYHHHHHHHHHQSRQTPPVVSLSALFTDSNSEVAAGMMEGEVITTPKRGHGVGLSSDMATQSLLLEPTPLSAPNDTVPSTLFDSLKAYTYGWTFQTSRDLEELLAAFIGYHNESYWQASETVPTAATGFARLSSFHSSLPTSPTSQPSSSGAAAQPFLRPPPPPLARFPFGSSQNYLLSGVMDPYPPGSSSSPLPGGDLSAGGLPRMLMEVRQRVCERRARGQEQKKREDGMPSLTCDAHPPTAAATSSSFHERQAHHAATWEDQWNAVVDPILKELL